LTGRGDCLFVQIAQYIYIYIYCAQCRNFEKGVAILEKVGYNYNEQLTVNN